MVAAARYREIADLLREDIAAMEAGDKLPAEPDLIERFGASRTTVRQALAELRDAGFVRMRHGVGVFVAAPRVVKRLDSRERLSRARRTQNQGAFLGDAAAQGFAPSSNVRVWFEPAGDYAESLEVEVDTEVCVRDRLMRADGNPVMLAVSRIPRDITRGSVLEGVDTGPGGALTRLEEYGYELTSHEEIVSSRMPEEHERQVLGLKNSPLLVIQRRTWSGERVVEINDMKMTGAGYELRYVWDAE